MPEPPESSRAPVYTPIDTSKKATNMNEFEAYQRLEDSFGSEDMSKVRGQAVPKPR